MTTRPLDLDTLFLAAGAHDSPQDGMCVLEAVAYLAGEPHTDHPRCASPVIGAFLRAWNDALADADRQELKRYIGRLVGSAASAEVEERRAWMACDWLVRTHTPAWLRLAGLTAQADRLAALPELSPGTVRSVKPVIEAVQEDARAARAAAWDAARSAVGDAAGAAAWTAAREAAGDAARDAVREAAGAAARAAGWAAGWGAAWGAAWDAAWAAAWDAASAVAWVAAWDAAAAAARAALAPTVTELQASAHDLVNRMLDAAWEQQR